MTRLDDTVILFDWNGTIVLDADRARSALNAVLGARALPELDAEEFRHRFRLPMHGLFGDLGVHESEFGQSEAEWNAGMQHGAPVPRAGLRDALVHLHAAGARLGIVSAASADAIASDLRELGLPDVWDCVRGGVSDKRAVLLEERGDRAAAIYVGDTVYDMVSAIGAGFRAFGVAGGYTAPEHLENAGAEAILADLRDLDGLLTATR